MKLSTRVRYGSRAMIDIARLTGDGKGVTIATIAESQDLSQKYLETLLVKLKTRGLLTSLRGKNGGYSLNKAPEDINVYDIYEALEGKLDLVHCGDDKDACPRKDQCDTLGLWAHLTNTLTREMESITLKDLMNGK